MSLGSIFSKLLSRSKGGSKNLLGSFFGRRKTDPRTSEGERRQRAISFLGGEEEPYYADDAPNIFVPEPLVQSPTTFVPQATEVPQIIEAPRGQIVGDFRGIFSEIERINQNISSIQVALANSAAVEQKYRDDLIKERQQQIALRDKLRSTRRFSRRRSNVVGRMTSSVLSAPVQAGRTIGTSLLQTGLMVAVSSLIDFVGTFSEGFDQFVESIQDFGDRIKNFAVSIRDKFNEILGKLEMPSIPDLLAPIMGLFGQQQKTSNEYLQAAVELIRTVEGTTGKAGASTFFVGIGDTTRQPYGNIEPKTFNEVAELQKKSLREGKGKFFNKATGKMDQSVAVGIGQFMYPEQALRQYLGEDPATTLFTEEKQIELMVAIAAKKRGVDLSKELTLSDLKKLSPEWAGLGRFLQQTTRTEAQSLQMYKDILKKLRQNKPSSTMPNASQSGALGDPSNSNSPRIGQEVGSYPIAPKSREVASIGRVTRPPVIIDARVAKKVNSPQPPPSFAVQDEVASIEPRLVNTGYESMFAV